MANPKFVTTLTLPTALIEQCKEAYCTANTSEAIRNALTDFLLLPYTEQKIDSFAVHQLLPDIEDRQTLSKVTLRLDDNLRRILLELSAEQDSLSKTAELMISHTLNAEPQEHSTSLKTDLLYILGNKRDSKMQDAIRTIKDTAQNVRWETCIETCVGVLGIYSNFRFANTEIMNDNDWNKINLYKAIQENPRRLIILARALKVDTATFNAQKSLLDNTKHSAKVNYEAASAYLYLNKNSFRHEGTVLNNKATQSSYHKRLAAIAPLHQRMNQTASSSQATKFQNIDLLKLIEKYRRQKHVLFIVDPPYLDVDYYNKKSGNAVSDDSTSKDSVPDDFTSDSAESDTAKSDDTIFGEAEHKKLARLLQLVKQNNGNNFIYFCRITAAKSDQKKPNAEEWDRHMHGRIDDLYHGHGFYCMDVALDDATTERIITSFPFKGATLYGKGVR